jgi:APA family basic amino acid/polyamine antiporter
LKEKMAAPSVAPGGPEDADEGLSRVLGGVDAWAIAVGIVVGTGIFAVPGFVARELGAPGPILLAWLLGGAIALCGALSYAEIASQYPRQGGGFLFVLHAYGPFAAFFKGWGSFLVGYPASSAAIATILAIYLVPAAGWSDAAVKPVAIAAAAVVWLLNLRGTRFSAGVQTSLTLAKVGAIAVLALLAVAVGPASWTRLTAGSGSGWPGVGAFGAALVGVLWTYDGWENLTVVGGEIGDPKRRIVRGLVLTIGVVSALYLLVNIGYLVLLPLEELSGTDSAASAAATAVLGPAGGRLISILVVISAFGALFGIGIAGPRYFWSMARHGLFFQRAGRLSPRTQAPRWGATMLFAVTTIYVLTGTFEQLLGYYVAVSLLYNVLAVTSVFRLRAKFPARERPFRVPGYPVVPIVFVAAALGVTASEIARSPVRSGIGLLVLLTSLPAYRVWRRRHPAAATAT